MESENIENLTAVPVNGDKALCRAVKALYVQSFPKEERIPWWLLRLSARRKGIGLTAYLHEGSFCGFTASVCTDGLQLLLFFAVEIDLRGQGYGSGILRKIRSENRVVALNIEPLDPQADNYSQRQCRFAFYQKNGFLDTCYHVWEVGGMFRVLSTERELDVKTYKKAFRKLTFGLWNVKLRKEEE